MVLKTTIEFAAGDDYRLDEWVIVEWNTEFSGHIIKKFYDEESAVKFLME